MCERWDEWRASGYLPLAETIYAAWRYPRVLGPRVVEQMLRHRLETTDTLLDRLRQPRASRANRSLDVLLPNRARLLDVNAAARLDMPRESSLDTAPEPPPPEAPSSQLRGTRV